MDDYEAVTVLCSNTCLSFFFFFFFFFFFEFTDDLVLEFNVFWLLLL